MQSNSTLPDNTIWHLIHSSFLIKIDGIVMVFDYYVPSEEIKEEDGLQTGVIRSEVLAGEEVYVFASHGHEDHFSPVIFEWQSQVADIHYIISYDIPKPPRIAAVFRPGEEKEVGNIRIKGYSSTDDGLAYSIYAHGRHIYFSGDNAFWNWDGDLDDAIYERIALSEIDRQTPMDIAFQVCDPRLDAMGDGGIHVFARNFSPKLLVPIHSFGKYAFNAVVEKRLRESGFTNAFWCVSRRGDMYSISI